MIDERKVRLAKTFFVVFVVHQAITAAVMPLIIRAMDVPRDAWLSTYLQVGVGFGLVLSIAAVLTSRKALSSDDGK